MKSKIGIVGSGHLAYALFRGKILNGYSPSDIAIIHREGTSSDLSLFRGAYITSEIHYLENCFYRVLAVIPGAWGDILRRIKSKSINSVNCSVISFVSSLSTNDILHAFSVSYAIKATCNTNIAYGHGVICANGNSDVFHGLGEVITTTPKKIERYVVMVGSGQAFDYTSIYIFFTKFGFDITIKEWLIGLKLFLENPTIAIRDEYLSILQFLHHKKRIFQKLFGLKELEADQISTLVMKSCINTLLSIDCITCSKILELRNSSITNEGCTQQGVYKITSIDHLLSERYLSDEIYLPVQKRNIRFRNDIQLSLKENF